MTLKAKLIAAGLLAANAITSYAVTTDSCVKAWFTSDSESKVLNFSVRNICTQKITQPQLTNMKFVVANPSNSGVDTIYGKNLFKNGAESASWSTVFNAEDSNHAAGIFASTGGMVIPLELESSAQTNWIRSGADYLPIDAAIANKNLSITNNVSGELLYDLSPSSLSKQYCSGANCSCSTLKNVVISGLTRSKRIDAANQNIKVMNISCDKSSKTCHAKLNITNIPQGKTSSFPIVNIIDPASKTVLTTLTMVTKCQVESAGDMMKLHKPTNGGSGLKFW